MDPTANLDPRCTGRWQSGHQKACIVYDFDNCLNPSWPTSCPELSDGPANGCLKFWCPGPDPGELVSTTITSSSTITDTTTIAPGSDYPFDFLGHPGSNIPLIVTAVLLVLSVIGLTFGCVWKRLLMQSERDNIKRFFLEQATCLKRVLWIFLSVVVSFFVCAFFPLMLLIAGFVQAYFAIRSACLNRRKRPADWEPPVPVAGTSAPSPVMQGFSGFHTTNGTSGAPSQTVELDSLNQQPSAGTVPILLPNATTSPQQQQPLEPNLCSRSLLQRCNKWLGQLWSRTSQAAPSPSDSIVAGSDIRWVDASHQGTSGPQGTGPQANLMDFSLVPRSKNDLEDSTPPASPSGSFYRETSHRYKSRFARKLFNQPTADTASEFSFDIANAPQSTQTASFSDFDENSNNGFETAFEGGSGQTSSGPNYSALQVTARFNAMAGPPPPSSHNLTGRLEAMVDKIKAKQAQSSEVVEPSVVRENPPPPQPKPDFRDHFSTVSIIPPNPASPMPSARVLSMMINTPSGVNGTT